MHGDGDDDVMMMAEQTNKTLTLRACVQGNAVMHV